MFKVNDGIRSVAKLVSSGSVQVVFGGVVAAVMPANMGLVFKAATYIGGMVVASRAGEVLDKHVDHICDQIEEIVNDAELEIKITKDANNNESEDEG